MLLVTRRTPTVLTGMLTIGTVHGPAMNETERLTSMDAEDAVEVHHRTKVQTLECYFLSFTRLRSSLLTVGRKRRRSLSPYDRERYDPRPRYNDDYGLLLAFFQLFWLT
jgi:hypothetical protein